MSEILQHTQRDFIDCIFSAEGSDPLLDETVLVGWMHQVIV